jgi:predicted outer membrane repeat protein
LLPSLADANSALKLTNPVLIRAGLDSSGSPLVTLTRGTVSGTPNFRLIATSADLSLQGLKLSNGVAADLGGAINASGTANLYLASSSVTANTAASSGGGLAADCGGSRLKNSIVSGNSANKNGGGIYTSNYLVGGGHCVSYVVIQSSKVTSNTTNIGSGGVYSFSGSVDASYSTFDDNHAGRNAAGGIYAFINVGFYNSTVSNNTSGHIAGGLSAASQAYLYNTTVSANFATDEAGGVNAYAMMIAFSTIAANTVGPQNYPLGGVEFLGSANIRSSIIAGNMGGNIIGEAPVSGSHNLVGSNLPGQSIALPPDTLNCNPNLGPLADGGPTKTMALQAGSCAIDKGPTSDSAFPSDQRGARFARRVGAAIDIGAFEVQTNDRIFYDGFGT